MTDVPLAEARTARTRMSRQLAGVQSRRPGRDADTATRAAWLRDKAGVHDQIAGYLRRIGDTAGAIEAEVLATRCRADACDLVRDDGTVTTILGPCPGYPVSQPRSHAFQGSAVHEGPPSQRAADNASFDDRSDDRIDDRVPTANGG